MEDTTRNQEVIGTGMLTKEGFFPCSSLGQLMPWDRFDEQYKNDQRRLNEHLTRQRAALGVKEETPEQTN